MKRLILIVFVIISAYTSWAEPISKDKAKSIASKIISSKNPFQRLQVASQKATTTQKDYTTDIELVYTAAENDAATLYVYSNPNGGFVIISADDAVNPIIAYSNTSQIADIEHNIALKHELDDYSKIIDIARKNGNPNAEKVAQTWRELSEIETEVQLNTSKSVSSTVDGDTINMGPLVTSHWGQSGLYNKYCPGLVGCIAVAMGEIMHYHQWPQTGQSWHRYIPYGSSTNEELFVDFGNTTYNWDLMPDIVSRKTKTDAANEVAKFLYHVGVAVNMEYGKEGSSAYDVDIPYAMCEYFKYDPSTIKLVYYEGKTRNEWLSIIKNEINHKRPIVYSGSTKKGEGHAWVVDGYDNNNYLHCNWGWNGDGDGYFSPKHFILYNYDFSNNAGIIIGIQPNLTGYYPMLWTQQSSNYTKKEVSITNIAAIDNLTAWSSAYKNDSKSFLEYGRTTDGGKSWLVNKMTFSDSSRCAISMICAIDKTNAWATVYKTSSMFTSGGKIVHTNDGGATWSVQTTNDQFIGSDAYPNSIHFWDANNGVCIGDPNDGYFEIYTTTNGGNEWTRVSQASIPSNQTGECGINAHLCVYNNNLWFGTNKGRLFMSNDRGYTWTVSDTPFSDFFEMAFRNDSVGVIICNSDTSYPAFRTSDGGKNWEKLNYSGHFYPTSLAYMPNTDTLISIGGEYNELTGESYYGLSYSTDNGESWTDYADFYQNYPFTAIGIAPSGAAWVGSYSFGKYLCGMWYRGRNKAIPVSIDEKTIASWFDQCNKLLAFPNPTRSTISFVGFETGQLTIVNSIGQNVYNDNNYNSGTIINISNLAPGLYIANVKTNNGLNLTTKFQVY